jgi:serine/threonine-protein kinase RsbW
MSLMERRITISAVVPEIAIACDFVDKAAREAGLDEESVYHCHLSVEEICTNVIEHGYGMNGADKVVDIVCKQFPDRFVITVIDDAAPFDPLSQPEPEPDVPLWERVSDGGWGIYFVKRYMDGISYQFVDNRNHLIVEKLLP